MDRGLARAQVLRAPRDLEADDEVFITYGYDGNDHLLLDYGFVPPAHDPADFVHLPLPPLAEYLAARFDKAVT